MNLKEDEYFLPLLTAIKIITNIGPNESIHKHEKGSSYELFAKTYRARQSWTVQTHTDEQKETYVHIGQLIEWAWDLGFKTDEQSIDKYKDSLSGVFYLKKDRDEKRKHIKDFQSHKATNITEEATQKNNIKNIKIELNIIEERIRSIENTSSTEPTNNKINKVPIIEQRMIYIMSIVNELKYSPLNIEYGGKKIIEKMCLLNNSLFTQSTFEKAWQRAKRDGLIEVADVEKYKSKDDQI